MRLTGHCSFVSDQTAAADSLCLGQRKSVSEVDFALARPLGRAGNWLSSDDPDLHQTGRGGVMMITTEKFLVV